MTSDAKMPGYSATDVITVDSAALSIQLAPTDLIDPASFDETRRQQADVIAAGASVIDSNAIATFGAAPQRKLSGFLDQLLAATRADEIGLGVLEQLVVGPYAPTGLGGLLDGA